MIISKNLKPSSCFNITYLDNNEYPFNVRFSNKRGVGNNSDFYGPGIYSIFDKINNQVVYIGLWRPNDKSVVNERFRKHIQTLTIRGNNVRFDKNLNFTLQSFCQSNNAQNLYDALSKCSSIGKRLHSGGIVSSTPKVKYASKNWYEFSSWSNAEEVIDALDNRFTFQYNKIDHFFDEELEAKVLRAQIRRYFELPLIQHCNPIANAEYKSDKITLEHIDKSNFGGSDVISNMIENIIKDNKSGC